MNDWRGIIGIAAATVVGGNGYVGTLFLFGRIGIAIIDVVALFIVVGFLH